MKTNLAWQTTCVRGFSRNYDYLCVVYSFVQKRYAVSFDILILDWWIKATIPLICSKCTWHVWETWPTRSKATSERRKSSRGMSRSTHNSQQIPMLLLKMSGLSIKRIIWCSNCYMTGSLGSERLIMIFFEDSLANSWMKKSISESCC